MRRAILLLSLALFFLALAPARAEACTCRVSGPPCQEVWESPIVFVGTVIAVDQTPGAIGPHRVRFRITEAFRGTEKGEIEIHLRGGGGPSCDPPFRLGESWLVYGSNRWEGGPGWTASICSRTKPLRAAAEDLAYLRTPHEKKPPSHIAGRVTRHVYDLSQRGGGQDVPIADVPVIVTGQGTRFEAKTDRDGRYSIPVDGGQVYQVQFERVDGFVIRGSGQQISLPHYRSCATAGASALYDGRLSGQINDDGGRPVPFLPITLVSSPRYLMQHTMTDVAGRFEFREVYPAAHIVSPSTELWQQSRALPPLTPAPITVPPSGRVDVGRLRFPSSVKMTLVEILIEDSAGKPASGARVTFRQADGYHVISYAPPADETGTFRVSVVAGQRYAVEAGYSRKTPADPVYETGKVVFDATGLKPIRLRLAQSR